MKTLISVLISSIILLLILWYIDDYTVKQDTSCVVVGKLQSSGGYKSEGSFYIVYRIIDSGKTFDRSVSPSTYSTAEVGSIQIIKVAEADVRQTIIKNILFFFLPAFLGSIIFVIGLATFILLILGEK